jgi:hypothetical protein
MPERMSNRERQKLTMETPSCLMKKNEKQRKTTITPQAAVSLSTAVKQIKRL